MDTLAVVFEEPERLALRRLDLTPPEPTDVVVDIAVERHQHRHRAASLVRPDAAVPRHGISAGPRLRIGRARSPRPGRDPDGATASASSSPAPAASAMSAACSAVPPPASSSPASGCVPVDESLGEQAVLLALAATAYHAIAGGAAAPDLIVGHGVLGRLLARLAAAERRRPPVVWETQPAPRRRRDRSTAVIHPDADTRRDYRAIYDVSGDAGLLDTLIERLAPGRRGGAGRLLQRAAVLRLSRRPSCARPASASPPSGPEPIWPPSGH